MNQNSYLTNGSSLEDCHTNFFGLADLCGIKWRQYSCDKNYNDLNDDPILNSYAKCIEANLLCVWRRIRNTQESTSQPQQNGTNQRDLYINYSKELWVFWYGDEPDLKQLVSPNLKEVDQGSMESGLSYECRTLIFKALHNLLERGLLSKGYARIGDWFFQPRIRNTTSDILKEGTQITFRFNFFLHGDSNVCANVDVHQHSSVRTITKEDIHMAQQLSDGVQVILSPYGCLGYLTGYIFKENDPQIQKFLSDWTKIFPLPHASSTTSAATTNSNQNNNNNQKNSHTKDSKSTNNFNSNFINNNNQNNNSTDDLSNNLNNNNGNLSTKVVEVIINNNRMKYPASYVYITDTDANLAKTKLSACQNNQNNNNNIQQQNKLIASSQMMKNLFIETSTKLNKQCEEHLENIKLIMAPYYHYIPNDTYFLKNNFNQVANFNNCDHQNDNSNNTVDEKLSSNNINELTINNDASEQNSFGLFSNKRNCNCNKCHNLKGHLKQQQSSSNKIKSEKEKSKCSLLSNNKFNSSHESTPFHHRTPMNLQHDLNSLLVLHQSTTNNCRYSSSSTATNVNNLESSELNGTTINGGQTNNQPNSIGPMIVPYKSPMSANNSVSSILNTPGVESSPMSSNFNMESNNSNEHNISPAMAQATSSSKEEITLINTPHSNINQQQINSPKDPKSVFDSQQPNSNNNNNVCDPALRNGQQDSATSAVGTSDQQQSLSQLVSNNNNNNDNDDNNNNMNLEKRHFKRCYRYKSLYDDDVTLQTGLLYDFSNETTLIWEETPPKNRRFKPSNPSEESMINADYQNSDNRDPYEFSDFDDPSANCFEQNNNSNSKYSDALAEQITTNGLINCPNGINGISSDFNGKTNLNSNQKNFESVEQQSNKPVITNNIPNGNLGDTNLPTPSCEIDFLNSPAEDGIMNSDYHSIGGRYNNNNNQTTNTNNNETTVSTLNSSLGTAELLRMFPTPPSLEAMVASPCSTYVNANETNNRPPVTETNNKPEQQQINNQIINKIEIESKKEISITTISGSSCMVANHHNEDDSKESTFVYMPPVQSIFITSDKYAPLDNLDCKNKLPMCFQYKHNVTITSNRNRHQSSKSFGYNLSSQHNSHFGGHQNNQPQFNCLLNKSKAIGYPPSMGHMNKMNSPLIRPRGNCPPTPNPMMSMNSPLMQTHPRMRNQIQQQQQYSPQILDNFNSSPITNLDNRRSPFVFPINSPNSNNIVLSANSPAAFNHQNGLPPPKNMSPIMGPNNLHHPHAPHHHPAHLHQHHSLYHMNHSGPTDHNLLQPISNECNSLMFNLLLSDSMFNLFRDHNFDSCSLCVCNMNIKGNDVGIYLPDLPQPPQQQQMNSYDYYQNCTCGFSAVTNRHLSYSSGLFYEDEVEITNMFYDPIIDSTTANKENNQNELHQVLEKYVDKELCKSLMKSDENFLKFILYHSSTIYPSLSTLSSILYCERKITFKTFNLRERNMHRDPQRLKYEDYTSIILTSLQMTRIDQNVPGGKQNMLMPNFNQNMPFCSNNGRPVLHEWQFKKSNFPVNNHDVMLTLKTLQPLMQESVQRKDSMNDVTFNNVKGPLTWRQFHRLAGRGGTEDQCEPQPIPPLLVGYDKDCVSLSPFGLKFWEKMSLEPYAINRDVYYIVITENDQHNLPSIKKFFKELSTTYEIFRLGRHAPLTKVSSDGIKLLSDTNSKYVDEWFNQLGDSELAHKIRQYAQAIADFLPHLALSDRGIFETKSHNDINNSSSNINNNNNNNGTGSSNQQVNSNNNNNQMSTMNGNLSNSYGSSSLLSSSSSTTSFNNNNQKSMNNNNNSFSSMNNNNNQNNNSTDQLINELNDSSHNNSNTTTTADHSGSSLHNTSNTNNTSTSAFHPYDEEEDPHKLPSIMIYILEPFSKMGKDMTKLGTIGLLKTFSIMRKYFPQPMKNNIHMQILSLNSVLGNDKDFRDNPRQSQLKELAFSSYCQCKQQLIMQSNIKSLTGLGPAASFETFFKNKNPLFNRTQLYTTPYILAPLKDKQTELSEMFSDRRERCQILFCSYCLTEDKKWLVASCTNDKGDILHTKLININIPSRTRRRKASARRFGLDKLMRFIQTVMAESVLPWRLIIGRLGRIGHGELKDWTYLLSKKSLLKYSRQLKEMCEQCRYIGQHEQPAIYSACLISLEADTSLRVFPNYYTPDERFHGACNNSPLSTPEDASCTHILVFPTSATTLSSHANFNLGEEFFANLDESDIPVEEEMDGFFENFWSDGLLSPRRDPQPDSPTGNRHVFGGSNLKNSTLLEVEEEPAQLSQQPLALAFYVSTAKTGPLPRWFWTHCPHLENTCPVFLKSALLIHTPFVQQNTDDLLQANNRDCHALDSNLTTDVLRYSLEGYNALSWLVFDPVTNDRLSCLPLHIQVLMQLYHTVQALVQ